MENLFGISLSRGGSASTSSFGPPPLRTGLPGHPLGPPFRLRRARRDRLADRRTSCLAAYVGRPEATAYVIDPTRSGAVAEDILGLDYDGTMIHDGWSPYDWFGNARHQQCLQHLLRRADEMAATATRGAVRFPRRVAALLRAGLDLRDRHAAGEVSRHGLAVARGRLENQLNDLIFPPKTNAANERLAQHLWNHRDDLFTFLRQPGLDATNWRAELAIRFGVILRKVWGGSRTWAGARAQSVLMSVWRTCWQQGCLGSSRPWAEQPPAGLPWLSIWGLALRAATPATLARESGICFRPVPWCLDQPRAHRVELNVPHGRQQIRLIEHERGEPPLPEMPAPSLAEVDHTRVTAMHLADRASQSVGRVRNCDEMDMIGHQAVRPDLDLVGAAPLPHELQVDPVIFIAKERLLPAVSPLGDVVRQARCDHSCQSGHDRRLSSSRPGVNNCVRCPRNPIGQIPLPQSSRPAFRGGKMAG